MTLKKLAYHAALVPENCHSEKFSSDLGRVRMLRD